MKVSKRIKKAIGALAALTIIGSLLGGCGNAETQQPTRMQSVDVPSASADVFAMDTYMTITCYGEKCEEALDASCAEIDRLDQLLSIGNTESDISKLNAQGNVTFANDTAAIVEAALDLYASTNGKFDITVYPLMELWGFTSGEYQVPSEEQLKERLKYVDSSLLSYNADTKSMALNGAEGIDLGGIAKGYTSDRLMKLFEEYDLVAGLVSLGGNVECYNTKPNGDLWKCGIQDPLQPDNGSTVMGIISVADEAVITSGAYERYFEVSADGTVVGAYEDKNIEEQEGQTYHHIIDPDTGYPAKTGILSVTIVSKNGLLADGLSTSCYVMGLDQAIDYWRTSAEEFDFIIMTDEQEIYMTETLKDRFETDYPLHIVTREESHE